MSPSLRGVFAYDGAWPTHSVILVRRGMDNGLANEDSKTCASSGKQQSSSNRNFFNTWTWSTMQETGIKQKCIQKASTIKKYVRLRQTCVYNHLEFVIYKFTQTLTADKPPWNVNTGRISYPAFGCHMKWNLSTQVRIALLMIIFVKTTVWANEWDWDPCLFLYFVYFSLL